MGVTSYSENDYRQPTVSTGYDFLSAFNALAFTSSFSDSSSPHSLSDPDASPQGLSTIDPALVSTPCTGQALAEFEHQGQNAEQHEINDDEGDNSNNDNEYASSSVTSEAAAASPFT